MNYSLDCSLKMSIKFGPIPQVNLSTKEDNNCNKVDKRHDDFFPWFGQDLPPRCGDLLWSKVALNPF
jgi:hypothetical protein